MAELNLAPAVAATLESWGLGPDQAPVRDQCPAAARGTSMVLAWPPAARHAIPAMAGLISAAAAGRAQALLLAPAHTLDEWADPLLPLCHAAGLQAQVARQPARATRRLRDQSLQVLLTAPEVAAALVARSALKPESLSHVFLAWPELYQQDDTLTSLMQDLPRESQRILCLARPGAQHELVERYARRAFTVGPLATAAEAGLPPGARIRTVSTAWELRAGALNGVLEVLDPSEAAVWAADRASAARAEEALGGTDRSVEVVTGEPAARTLVVAWDLPTPDLLTAMSERAEVVLLVPPHGREYVESLTGRQTPIRLPGALDQARTAAAELRSRIEHEIEAGDLGGELLALAPLFARHDPSLVAAALARLSKRTAAVSPAPPPPTPAAGGTVQVWVGAGRKDEVSANDIVAALTKEVGVHRTSIGRIEIRELYSLVELPAAEAEDICGRLTGRTIRRRRVVARLDKRNR